MERHNFQKSQGFFVIWENDNKREISCLMVGPWGNGFGFQWTLIFRTSKQAMPWNHEHLFYYNYKIDLIK